MTSRSVKQMLMVVYQRRSDLIAKPVLSSGLNAFAPHNRTRLLSQIL
jgi:hypothetical protein